MLDLHLTVRGNVELCPNESLVKCDSANVDLEGEDIGKLVRNTLNNGLALMDWLDTTEGHEFLIEYLTAMPDDHLQTLYTKRKNLNAHYRGALQHVTHK